MATIAQHRASTGLQAIAGMVEDHLDRWAAEVDRLKATNAVLMGALVELAFLGEGGMRPNPREWLTFHDKVAQVATAALKTAKETE